MNVGQSLVNEDNFRDDITVDGKVKPWRHDPGEIEAVIESSQADRNNKTFKSNNRSESGVDAYPGGVFLSFQIFKTGITYDTSMNIQSSASLILP